MEKGPNFMATYAWRTGGPRPKISAQTFGETVEKIANGALESAKPEDIVEAARSARSPIHALFEWKNDKAAELYRRDQARQWIGALQIVRVQIEDGPTVSNRAFFSVRTNSRTGYMPHDKILSDKDLKKQVLDSARGELESYMRKFSSVMALGNYVPRLQELIDAMRDEADQIVVDATKRTAARETVSESPATAPT
jgi:hypothetical protein